MGRIPVIFRPTSPGLRAHRRHGVMSAPDPLALELSLLDRIRRLATLLTASRTTRGAFSGAKARERRAPVWDAANKRWRALGVTQKA